MTKQELKDALKKLKVNQDDVKNPDVSDVYILEIYLFINIKFHKNYNLEPALGTPHLIYKIKQ